MSACGCPGTRGYGHGLTATTVHDGDCCHQWRERIIAPNVRPPLALRCGPTIWPQTRTNATVVTSGGALHENGRLHEKPRSCTKSPGLAALPCPTRGTAWGSHDTSDQWVADEPEPDIEDSSCATCSVSYHELCEHPSQIEFGWWYCCCGRQMVT
jgi:hypothetical protein